MQSLPSLKSKLFRFETQYLLSQAELTDLNNLAGQVLAHFLNFMLNVGLSLPRFS